jgi:hypothetical protein
LIARKCSHGLGKQDNEIRPTSARTSILCQWESFSQPEPSWE